MEVDDLDLAACQELLAKAPEKKKRGAAGRKASPKSKAAPKSKAGAKGKSKAKA